jgi:uncharacterized protein YjbI with pentapeptide repeats
VKIEIKSRFDGHVILSGEYESVKDCLRKNSGANLSGANLSGANLWGANLWGANLSGANLSGADLSGANLSGANLSGADLSGANLRYANLSGANLCGANLSGANLSGADLSGANLRYANLSGAYLSGAKEYAQHHAFFQEVIRQQKVELFVSTEWGAIAQICIHGLCWDAIKKRFSKVMPSIFKKLADVGYDEWLKYWEGLK